MTVLAYLFIGLCIGVMSGAFGIGGGAFMVPIMVFFYGLTQHQAQGTALAAMLPPITILAVLRYHHNGNVNFPMAIWLAVGLMIGALAGAHLVQGVPSPILKKAFGVVIIIIGLKMVL